MAEMVFIPVPDFSRVQLAPKVLTHEVTDTEIFRKAIADKTIITAAQTSAQSGDFVRFHMTEADCEKQVVLGSGVMPKAEDALTGCAVGDRVTVDGDTLTVLSVKRSAAPEISDELIASLNIPGVTTAQDYRSMYVNESRETMVTMVLMRINAGVMAQLKKGIVPDEAEVAKRYDISRVNLMKRAGDDVGYMKMMIDVLSLPESATMEQCDAGLLSITRDRMVDISLGMSLANRDGKLWSDAVRVEYLRAVADANDTTPEQVMTWTTDLGLMDAYYTDYLARCVDEYFKPMVKIIANGEEM